MLQLFYFYILGKPSTLSYRYFIE